MTKSIRAIVADEDRYFVNNLTGFLRHHHKIQVVGTAVDGPGAVEICAETLPDVVVLQLGLPGIDGIKTTRNILEIDSRIGVLVVAAAESADYTLQAIKMGAKGCVRKADTFDTIADVLCRLYEGEVYIPSELAALMLNEFDRLS